MTQYVEIKVLKFLGNNHKVGGTIKVPCDRDNIPLDAFWRKRLKDAAIDSCCEIVTSTKAKPAKSRAKPKS